MRYPQKPSLVLTERERSVLETLAGSRTVERRCGERATIILQVAAGTPKQAIARQVHLTRKIVYLWYDRWLSAQDRLHGAGDASDKEFGHVIEEILAALPRAGTPATFTAEQVCQIVALACKRPEDLDVPFSTWTPSELARAAVKQGIVASISPASVERFLKSGLHPHKVRYWLQSTEDDPQAVQEGIAAVCIAYDQAPALAEAGIHTVSTDEMTGIQALERLVLKPMRPGDAERVEFEYTRHGTQCLLANFDVVSGHVIRPTVSATRTEADFVAHLQQTVTLAPQDGGVFVMDQLNTHKSAALVRWVAEACGIPADLGVKGKDGVLTSMKTRAAFLSDPPHRIRIVYTPKHTSWLNQVEIWFSILVRRLLKRGNFRSTDHLKERILGFIEYVNTTLATPFQWTYKGKALTV